MARKSRIDAPGALHHIFIRGTERRSIFVDARDYQNILTRLKNNLTDSLTGFYAWALMTNHAHLLLRTSLVTISTVMRRLLTGYAQQFNRRHNLLRVLAPEPVKVLFMRRGTVFAGVGALHSFESGLRAGCSGFKCFEVLPQCEHAVLMGRQAHDWQDAEYILMRFGASVEAARRSYTDFVA